MADVLERNLIKEHVEDAGIFAGWMIFGVLVGWLMAYLAQHPWMESPIYDYYGIAGAIIAVMWVSFRRQRHLEHLQHLPHLRRHLEVAGRRKR